MATLKVVSGPNAGHSYVITGDEAVLGRYPFCDIVLPSHNVSRQHARIVRVADGYSIEDLNSRNGTFVNGQRIAGSTQLHDGDRLHFCEMLLEFQDSSRLPVSELYIGTTLTGDIPMLAAEGPATMRALPSAAAAVAAQALADPRVDTRAEIQLRALLEITRQLGRSSAVDDFLPKVLNSLFEVFPQSERGYILLAEKSGGPLAVRVMKQRPIDAGDAQVTEPIDSALAQRIMSSGEGVLGDASDSGDMTTDERSRSRISVPLIGPSGQSLGIIHIEAVAGGRPFAEADLELLTSVAAVTGQAVEHARAYEASLRHDRRERELATAREVQLHFLPLAAPAVPGYRFFEYYQAADDVGGDYFGYIPLNDGRLAIAMGDVSGKGVSAALLMARLCSDVRFCVATSSSPEDAMQRLNRELTDPLLDHRFVTFLLVVLDPAQHTLAVVSAGHLPPLLRRAATGELIAVGQLANGPPLGFDVVWTYTAERAELEPGDVLVMYTDGIQEATSPQDELFGFERICEVVSHAPPEPSSIGRQLLGAIGRFVDGRPQHDDTCLLCFGRDA